PGGPSPVEVFGRGLAGLVLSPLMIVAGIAQGIAFLPYTVGASLTDLNRALLQAQAVTLDDSYKAAFNVPVDDARVNQQTGEVAAEVIDWAAIEYRLLRQDKVVAMLMALAAEDVKSGTRRADFWPAEQRWLAGETTPVMQESLATVKNALPAS